MTSTTKRRLPIYAWMGFNILGQVQCLHILEEKKSGKNVYTLPVSKDAAIIFKFQTCFFQVLSNNAGLFYSNVKSTKKWSIYTMIFLVKFPAIFKIVVLYSEVVYGYDTRNERLMVRPWVFLEASQFTVLNLFQKNSAIIEKVVLNF